MCIAKSPVHQGLLHRPAGTHGDDVASEADCPVEGGDGRAVEPFRRRRAKELKIVPAGGPELVIVVFPAWLDV
eukprot:13560962-Alexandrium_andersonii.AAC.1